MVNSLSVAELVGEIRHLIGSCVKEIGSFRFEFVENARGFIFCHCRCIGGLILQLSSLRCGLFFQLGGFLGGLILEISGCFLCCLLCCGTLFLEALEFIGRCHFCGVKTHLSRILCLIL